MTMSFWAIGLPLPEEKRWRGITYKNWSEDWYHVGHFEAVTWFCTDGGINFLKVIDNKPGKSIINDK